MWWLAVHSCTEVSDDSASASRDGAGGGSRGTNGGRGGFRVA